MKEISRRNFLKGAAASALNVAAKYKEAKDGKAVVLTETGVETVLPCDSIVNAADMRPNTELLEGISVAETYAIGDCANPYNIALAIRGGNDAGRAV